MCVSLGPHITYTVMKDESDEDEAKKLVSCVDKYVFPDFQSPTSFGNIGVKSFYSVLSLGLSRIR